MSNSFIVNKETPTGFCHQDEKPSPDTHRSQIESLLNPLTMSETDKERERRVDAHKQREGEIERCKMERITNECAAEREP